MIQLQIIVNGDVQGVGFRYFTQMKATQNRINGWVKNCVDGSVEIVAAGAEEDMKVFLEEIRHGNPFSKVSHISYKEIEPNETFHSFKIIY